MQVFVEDFMLCMVVLMQILSLSRATTCHSQLPTSSVGNTNLMDPSVVVLFIFSAGECSILPECFKSEAGAKNHVRQEDSWCRWYLMGTLH